MSRRILTDAQESRIITAYTAGQAASQVAIDFGIAPHHVYNALKRAGVERRTTSESRTGWRNTPAQRAEVVRVYLEEGGSVHRLAKRLRCRTAVVSEILATENVPLHPGGRVHPRLTPPQETRLASDYLAGISLSEVADKYSVSVSTACNVLRRQGVETQEPGRQEFWTADRIDSLLAMYRAGISERAIGIALGGITQAAVNRRLRYIGAISPTPKAKGPDHGAWKGGKSKNGSGYVLVRVTDEDLPYCSPNVSGYVLEHRLVMGRAFGRKLTRKESVHHINGDRADNRLENLQLRQGQHGVGVVVACLDCGSHNVVAMPLAG